MTKSTLILLLLLMQSNEMFESLSSVIQGVNHLSRKGKLAASFMLNWSAQCPLMFVTGYLDLEMVLFWPRTYNTCNGTYVCMSFCVLAECA